MQNRSVLGANTRAVFVVTLAALAAIGCDDDGDTESTGGAGRKSAAERSSTESPLYVIATAVTNEETSTTYVKTVSSLDGRELSLEDAREFGGWSDMKVLGGWVFVSSGEEPIVERFEVDKRGELTAAGRIGFADYGEIADLYMHVLISPTKAYFTTEKEYVIWNPTTLEITGTIPFPDLPKREGIEPFVTMDRGTVIRDGRLFHAVSWTDTMNFKMTDSSQVFVVDVKRDEIVDVLDAPCPDINVATQDDDGNLYFSNWVYSPGVTLVNKGAHACALKIPADQDSFDESWTVAFADVNKGHEGANLVYAGGRKALFSVFREDRNPYTSEVKDLSEWLFGGTNWDFASMDLDTHEVTPLPDLGEQGGGFYAYPYEDQLLLLAPQGDYSKTSFLALDDEGNTTEVLKADGWSTRIYPLDPNDLRD